MRNIKICELNQTPLEEQEIEICERKGVGHPDYICDAIMNEISVGLSREYMRNFGTILHHNIDKAMLVAGEVEKKFGGGRVTKPIVLVIGDRATFEVEGKSVPVNDIALSSSKNWFKQNMRFVDPEDNVKYQVEIKRGSEQLADIFKRKSDLLGANDTSAAVGYVPLTETERIVFETERFLNSKEFKKEHPESGEDIKVMGLRENSELNLTVAMAFVDRFVQSEQDYFKKKKDILEDITAFVKSRTDLKKTNVYLNTVDMAGRGTAGTYLTVLGTSADDGDGGQVGRGNRVNGLIPLNRPTCSEAAAGKNPVSHVGKIYNFLTYRIADRIYTNVPNLREVYVWLLSQIGRPIDDPKVASVQVIPKPGTKVKDIAKDVDEIVNQELDNIKEFTLELAEGRIPVC